MKLLLGKLYFLILLASISIISLVGYSSMFDKSSITQIASMISSAVQNAIVSNTSTSGIFSLVSALFSSTPIYEPLVEIVPPDTSPDTPSTKGDETDPLFETATSSGIIEPDPDRITMVFGGDVMLSGYVDTVIQTTGAGDYRYPWNNVASYLQQADITFVNLESIISDKGVVSTGTTTPKYRADPMAITGLQYAGVDVVSLANDHVFDYGRPGMEDCIKRLRSAGIKCIGAGLTYEEAYTPTYITVKGKKIAFLAYTNLGSSLWRATRTTVNAWRRVVPGTSGTAWLSASEFEQGIARARADHADLIIVSLHCGTLYSGTPNTDQDTYAHLAIDRGADIVIGSGPHVTQPTVVYDKGYNSYSLGNLIYDQREALYGNRGVTRGKILGLIWENGEVTTVIERKTLISEATCQPSFVQ
jgi:hypothetical protein